ncbi:MAG: hypothetical protein ACRCYO_05300, partial [Bacteroidia bacterium]
MALDEQTYEQIDRFLRGAMDANERLVFEERLSAEDELREELQWMKNLQQEMNTLGRDILKRQIAAIGMAVPAKEIATYTPAKNAVAPPKTSSMNWWWVLVVVGAIGAAVFWYIKATQGDHESFSNASTPNHDPSFISGGEIKPSNLSAGEAQPAEPVTKEIEPASECPVSLV